MQNGRALPIKQLRQGGTRVGLLCFFFLNAAIVRLRLAWNFVLERTTYGENEYFNSELIMALVV